MHIVLTWGWTVSLTKYEKGMWFTHSLRCSFQLDGLGLVLKSSKELTLHILTCREANEPLVLQEQWLDSFPFVKMVKWLFSTEFIVLFFPCLLCRGSCWAPAGVMALCVAPISLVSFVGLAREAHGAVSSATSSIRSWPSALRTRYR